MWLFLLGCLIAFIVGTGGTLLIGVYLLRLHEKEFLQTPSLGNIAIVVPILFGLLLSLIVGVLCVGLYVAYHFLSPGGRLYLIGGVVGTIVMALLVWRGSRTATRWEEQGETKRQEAAEQQEARFLEDYVRFFQAVSEGNIDEARILLGLGMPYTRKELLINQTAHYLPAVGELTLALRRQDLGSTAPIYLLQTPLEVAAKAGHTEMVRLLLEWQRVDDGTVNCLQGAITAAENAGHPEIAEFIARTIQANATIVTFASEGRS